MDAFLFELIQLAQVSLLGSCQILQDKEEQKSVVEALELLPQFDNTVKGKSYIKRTVKMHNFLAALLMGTNPAHLCPRNGLRVIKFLAAFVKILWTNHATVESLQ